MNHRQHDMWLRFSLYVGAFILLSEWIKPLSEVSGMQGTASFVFFIAVALLLYFLQVPKYWSALIKCLIILWTLHYYYFNRSIIQLTWLSDLVQEMVSSIRFFINGQWDAITNATRSELFYLLLWLITYLIKYWFQHKKGLFLFVILTIFYLSMLDTFTPYTANHSIVTCVTVGFILLGVNHYYRKHNLTVRVNVRSIVLRASGVVLFLVAGVVIASNAPKLTPQWPDPVPFLQTAFNQNAASSVTNEKRAGFRADDSQLGGPFQSDNRTVFTAVASERQYWKVESRDVYTGKGWESTPNLQTNETDSLLSITDYSNLESINSGEARLTFPQRTTILPYVYGTVSAAVSLEWSLDNSSERMTAKYPVSSYQVYYRKPVFSLKKLAAAVPKDFKPKKEYLQLPSTVPNRVKTLAEKITKGQDTWYEKASSIVEYFQSNGYIYDKQHVAVPKGKTDYVDQFLFDTKTGYCDNFSTSMVVMLRTLGIPARWAKGYQGGTYDETIGQNQNQYTITNDDAHSWVEVEIPDVGWVPFEPTIGYESNVDVYDDKPSSSNQDTEQDVAKEQQQKKEQDTTKTQEASASKQDTKQKSKTSTSHKQSAFHVAHWAILLWIIGTIAVIGIILFITRNKWMAYFLKQKIEKVQDASTFIQSYEAALKYCQYIYRKREKGETLKQYAMALDERFGTNNMMELTNTYDRLIYSKSTPNVEWEEIKELLKNFIIKTTG